MNTDIFYMRRALQLAELGRGNVSPNPLVGCVIVHEGRIIGEGYHRKYGGAHAEVNAVNDVANPEWLKESTVYVTLEPCSHHGKTPPCADLLVSRQVKKVVVAAGDPNPLVSGRGMARLRAAGIEVVSGVLEAEARALNVRFSKFFLKKQPYVILKWGQTSDGFVARDDFSSKWITNQYSRQLVHKWRAEEDAILVGRHTAGYDDPALTTRDWVGRNPVRVVLDPQNILPGHLQLFTDGNRTLVFNYHKDDAAGHVHWIRVGEENFLEGVLEKLAALQIQSLIVEGGSQTLGAFIRQGLWEEARVFVADKTFGSGISAPLLSRTRVEEINVEGDRLMIYKNQDNG